MESAGFDDCLTRNFAIDIFFLLIKNIHFSATKLNFRHISQEVERVVKSKKCANLEHLHFHFWPIKLRKVVEHSDMVSMMQEIHALFINDFFSNKSKCTHNRLPESLACDKAGIPIIHMLVGVTGKCWFLWYFDQQLHH